MQILDLVINESHQCINLLIENVLQNFPAKMSQFSSVANSDLSLRSNPDLGVDYICLRNILSWSKIRHIKKQVWNIRAWSSKVALESLESADHHLFGNF